MPPSGSHGRFVASSDLTAQPMQQREDGVVRSRPEIRAEHGIQGQCALQQRRVEGFLEHVEDVDAGDAQEFAHVVAAEAPDIETEHRGCDRVRATAAQYPGRAPAVLLREDPREAQHPGMMTGQRGAVIRGHGPGLETAVVEHEVLALARERHGLQVRARRLEPVRCEVELAPNRRIEQVQQVRARRYAIAGCELARHRRAADAIGGLEHDHLAPRFRQIRGAHQAVVPGADNDDPIAVSHPASPEG